MPRLVDGETQAWAQSDAKKLLSEDIMNGTVDGMGWRDVVQTRRKYMQSSRRLFANRLKNLRKQIDTAKGIAVDEEAALAHDRALFPIPSHNYRGEPRWDGSEAQRLLKHDIANGVHATMKPVDFQQTRPEYRDGYPLAVFRGHIYQEIRFSKFCQWRQDTGQKKATAWMK
jgi:hypothetical protein